MHQTERKFPEQCKRFKEITDGLYALHLSKNSDYSPYNILATGGVGSLTRIWDKTARLMSLGGFDIGTGEYRGAREASNESVEDTLRDLANYAIIELVRREGKWGK